MTFVFSPYAKLPLQVQTQIQEQMWNYKGSNLALLETSHRSPVFAKVNDDTILAIKLYLSVPNNYKILLMQGGEQLTQGSLPFNLLAGRNKCTYLITGPRSQFAQSQAALHPDVTVVSHTLQSFPSRETEGSAYTFVCLQDHQTGQYIGQPDLKEGENVVLDCTSILGLKPVDVSRYGMVFGSAEYSLGLPGVCIAIVREDLVGKDIKECPNMMSYATMNEKKSIYNTPNCFAVYTLGEHLAYLNANGGIEATHKRVQELRNYFIKKLDTLSHKLVLPLQDTFSILTFKPDDLERHNSSLQILQDSGILIPINNSIQINIQSHSTKSDIDLLFSAISQI